MPSFQEKERRRQREEQSCRRESEKIRKLEEKRLREENEHQLREIERFRKQLEMSDMMNLMKVSFNNLSFESDFKHLYQEFD